jgi:hypothetical protein
MNFITGNSFKALANFILDEHGFRKLTPNSALPLYFVKTDYIDYFFSSSLLPKNNFQLITHNSDFSINAHHLMFINNENIQKWFAQNVDYQHPKLIPIPIGIANPEWIHGDVNIIESIILKEYKKQKIIYANFNVKTNPKHRQYCLRHIDPQFIENNVSFETYLAHTAQSYFSICPLGNGLDSHRIWESLYLKTIPIVESTYNINFLTDKYKLPIIRINDWGSLHTLKLTENLYHQIMYNFNPQIVLQLKNFL